MGLFSKLKPHTAVQQAFSRREMGFSVHNVLIRWVKAVKSVLDPLLAQSVARVFTCCKENVYLAQKHGPTAKLVRAKRASSAVMDRLETKTDVYHVA